MIIFVTIVVLFFLFNIETQYKIYINYRVNPPGVVCHSLLNSYSSESLVYMAGLEYLYLEHQKSENGYRYMKESISSLGALPCFCLQQNDLGVPADQVYTFNFG